MEGARRGRRVEMGRRPVQEETRITIAEKMEEFRASSLAEMTFEKDLSNHDRAIVHDLAKKMGLVSKSRGKGENRSVTVSKRTERKVDRTPTVSSLDFSPDSQNVLLDLLTQYPPTELELSTSFGERPERTTEYKLTSNDNKVNFGSSSEAESTTENHLKSVPKKLEELPIFKQRQNLPIFAYRETIAETVKKNQVVIIAGQTGCGKTTQVPQYILDSCWAQGQNSKICCTQPRRISAVSVAERIAFERGEPIGQTVGYQIRLESQGSPQCSLWLMTTGILLRKLVGDIGGNEGRSGGRGGSSGPDFTHIIVDEIHERDKFSDFLLIILRDLLVENPNLRVVLMSATVDSQKFSNFFGGCPLIQVPGFTFPVKTYFLEDVLRITGYVVPNSSVRRESTEGKFPEGSMRELLRDLLEPVSELPPNVEVDQREAEAVKHYQLHTNQDEVDLRLLLRLLAKICQGPHELTDVSDVSTDGAILVFLPGWDEISRAREMLLASSYFSNSAKFVILPLHSLIPAGEQKRVFVRPPKGVRKIILSTNIAETAITIDDVVFVIDSGRAKEKSYDPYTNVSTLQVEWISKASAKQREGRAGRVRAGLCFHLYSKIRAAALPDYQEPEIKRTPLEEICLQVKMLHPEQPIRDFISKALEPPVPVAVHNAIQLLQDIGALTPEEKLTKLGYELGSLPLHPSISKMVIYSILFSCLDPALTVAVSSSYRDPFVLPLNPEGRAKAKAARRNLAGIYGGGSDHLALVSAVEQWKVAKQGGKESERRFCEEKFLSAGTLNMILGLRDQLLRELSLKGLAPRDLRQVNRNSNSPGIIRSVLAAGMYPMIGCLLPLRKGEGKKFPKITTSGGEKVKIHEGSVAFQPLVDLTETMEEAWDGGGEIDSRSQPLIVFDEITRSGAFSSIRSCTAVAPISVVLIGAEMVVAPLPGDSENEENEEGKLAENLAKKVSLEENLEGDGEQSGWENRGVEEEFDEKLGEDEEPLKPNPMAEEQLANHRADLLLSDPNNKVLIVVDRWLRFSASALVSAQLVCLRERIAAAFSFKVKHPRGRLPNVQHASITAISHILSLEGQLTFYPSETTNSFRRAPGTKRGAIGGNQRRFV